MKKWIPLIMIIIVVGGSVWLIVKAKNAPGKYDQLAQCINQSGTKFYGAFWCPHCQATKAMFGKSAKYLPYIECSQPSGSGQLPVCNDAQIEGYPTWEFAKPLVVTSDTKPTMCHPASSAAAANDPDSCKQGNTASQYRNVWIFADGKRIVAKDAPSVSGTTWTFPIGSRMTGELPLQTLADNTNCPLQ